MTRQISEHEGRELRRRHLARARRVVVKVGSAMLTGEDGLDREVIDNLAAGIVALRKQGLEVILVSSGAVASGRKHLGLGSRPLILKEKQAVAAVGQCSLMRVYEDTFARHEAKVAQILLTHADFSQRERYLNVRNTIFTLLDWQVLPIINENDTVSAKELRFGDNDTLAAMVANLTNADVLICLSDVDGLFTGNPARDPEARLIATVGRVDRGIEEMAGEGAGALGTGGMLSKIKAARLVALRGGCSFIGPGRRPEVLQDLLSGAAVGTFFLPDERKLGSRKHWIGYTLRPKGALVLDDGACRAIREQGRSLLPSGIRAVRGRFGIGDPVECLDAGGRRLAVGLAGYSSREIEKIKGLHSSRIESVLGYCDSEEVIHRDNLVLQGELP